MTYTTIDIKEVDDETLRALWLSGQLPQDRYEAECKRRGL